MDGVDDRVGRILLGSDGRHRDVLVMDATNWVGEAEVKPLSANDMSLFCSCDSALVGVQIVTIDDERVTRLNDLLENELDWNMVNNDTLMVLALTNHWDPAETQTDDYIAPWECVFRHMINISDSISWGVWPWGSGLKKIDGRMQ